MNNSHLVLRRAGLAIAMSLTLSASPLISHAGAMGGGGSAGSGHSMGGASHGAEGGGAIGGHGGYLKFKGNRGNAASQATITAIPNRNDTGNSSGFGYNGGYYGQGVYAPYGNTRCVRRVEDAGGVHDYRVC